MLPDGYRVTLEHQGSHWWYHTRRALFMRQVRRAARTLEPGAARHGRRLALLDYGCAAGFELGALAELGTAEGADIVDAGEAAGSAGVLAPLASAGTPVHLVPRDLPGLRARFDIVTCLDVLEHLDDDVAGLRTLASLLTPGGQVVVTVPAYPWLWSGEDVISQHRRRYTRRRLLGACRAAGLEILFASYFNLGILPAMAAVVWWRRLTHAGWRTESNLAAAGEARWLRGLHALAGGIAAVEARAVGDEWLSLPAGASVLCRLRRRPAGADA